MNAPIIYRDIEQNTPEWMALRAGKWTASSASIIMSKIGPNGGMTKGLQDLVKSVAFERVYGITQESRFESAAMARGHELEEEAREWYGFKTDRDIEQVAFIRASENEYVGFSPDGLFDGDKSGLEVKCLLHKAWMDVKRTGKVCSEYRWQVKWACWVGQLEALDFVAYHPQAGGLVIPCGVTGDEKQQMAERVELLESRVAEWINILRETA